MMRHIYIFLCAIWIKIKPSVCYRWKPLLGIFTGLICLLASILPSSIVPFGGQLELAAKTESEAINISLSTPWNWQESIKLNSQQLTLTNIVIGSSPFLELDEDLTQSSDKLASGSMTITANKGSSLHFNQLQLPLQQRLNLSSPSNGYLKLEARSIDAAESTLIKGKLTLIGSGEVCRTPSQGETICYSVEPSKIRIDAPRSIHFLSNAEHFTLTLPIGSANLFESQSITDIGFWELGVAQNFQEAPFNCGLIDGILIFTVSNQSHDLWRTECVTISGANLKITSDWADGLFHARVRGAGQADSSVMPSVLQGTLATPWISDLATAMGWIIAFISTLAFLKNPQL